MFLRAIIVHAVVGILLACPYPCLAQAVPACAPDRDVAVCPAGDCCCHSSRSDSANHQHAPRPSGQSGTCLCHGAVMAPVAEVSSPQAELVVPVCADDGLAPVKSGAAVDHAPLARAACHFPLADSGRMLRALIESLLI